MRPLTLNPASLVAGVVLAGLAFVTMSQKPVLLNARTVNVQYMPDPRDMVQISEGVPYVVPAGKLFVLTGLGSSSYSYSPSAVLKVDGHYEVSATSPTGDSSVRPVPAGFAVSAGKTIELLVNGQGDGRAWGYLAPQ